MSSLEHKHLTEKDALDKDRGNLVPPPPHTHLGQQIQDKHFVSSGGQ
jgi:hypothetical protein